MQPVCGIATVTVASYESTNTRYKGVLGRGDDTVGNPRRAQISQFELFELILLLKVDNQLHIEQFEATVSQSTLPSQSTLFLSTCLEMITLSIPRRETFACTYYSVVLFYSNYYETLCTGL